MKSADNCNHRSSEMLGETRGNEFQWVLGTAVNMTVYSLIVCTVQSTYYQLAVEQATQVTVDNKMCMS